MNLALIMGRGGSKRIPRKNVKEFCGAPMISWPVKAALASALFNNVIISTDSEEIAQVAVDAGAECLFMRPSELAGDYADTASVIIHTLEWLKDNAILPDFLCCIYATAPFLKSKYLHNGLDALKKSGATVAAAITSFPYSIHRGIFLGESGRLEFIWPENELVRSQDFVDAYHDAGQFYWLDVPKFLKRPRIFEDATPVFLPRWAVQDIDTQEDWEMAEKLFKAALTDC